jgi:hypothetical protein
MLLGVLLTTTAWVFLVGSAIGFGRTAKGGESPDWWFAAAATVGAACCLLLMFVLGARALREVGVISEPRAHRSNARHKN